MTQQAQPVQIQQPQMPQSGVSLQYISGKPSSIVDLILLIFNVLVVIIWLATGRWIAFIFFFVFTILAIVRLATTLSSGIVVNDTGVFGKIKKERFNLGYHEISSVSMADIDNTKNLLIVSGYNSYTVRISNATAVRDAIVHNMTVLGVAPSPINTPMPI